MLPCLAWLAWCAVHSLLASRAVQARLRYRLGPLGPWYRLGYNVFSLLSLMPVLVLQYRMPGRPLFAWSGWWTLPRCLLLAYGLVMFRAGTRAYAMRAFLGLVPDRDPGSAPAAQPVTGGILSLVRHPWYSAGIALVTALGPVTSTTLPVKVLLCLYFVAGALLEERRLVGEYGAAYAAYRRRVPMLIPRAAALARIARREVR